MRTRAEQANESSTPPMRLDVRQIAAELKLDVAATELPALQRSIRNNVAILDEFVQSNEAVGLPSEVSRRRFYAPSLGEDPLHAWLSRCSIPGSGEGALAGMTVSFKDTIATAGLPLTCGIVGLHGYIPEFDATVVRRALQEGATAVGKNTIIGGFGEGDPEHRPLNPHAFDHLSGGSSSGSAVAVVSRDVDVSFGGDQAGSIRVPAAWCGAVGLKPTFGLVSNFGAVSGSDQSVDHLGPIARTVQDAAAALEAVAGYDPLDPRQRRDVPMAVDVLRGLDHGIEDLRIGLLVEGFVDAEDDVADLVRAAVDTLHQAGARVRNVSVPEHRQVVAPYMALSLEGSHSLARVGPLGMSSKTYYPTSLVSTLNRVWARHMATSGKCAELMREVTHRLYEGRAYAVAHNVRPRFVAAYNTALNDVDLLAMPTCLFKAPQFKGPDRVPIDDFPSTFHDLGVTNTLPFNYTGHPALAVPCGKSDGLPVSLQLVGRQFDDALVLRAGYAFQESVPFDDFTATSSVL